MAGWIVKFDGPCSKCGTLLRAGTLAIWDRQARKMSCVDCPGPSVEDPSPPPLDTGSAGASAAREYALRQAKRETANTKKWGERVGGWVSRFGAEPQSIRAWGLGARGEPLLGAALASVPGLVVLNDRRVPGSRANIDHILVAAAGVFVGDAKFYEGIIEVVDRGGFFRTDLRLTVGHRERSNLADGMEWQVKAVIKALVESNIEPLPPITAVLCFVDGNWPIFRAPKSYSGVMLESERSIVRLLTASAVLDDEAIDRVSRVLAKAFPAK